MYKDRGDAKGGLRAVAVGTAEAGRQTRAVDVSGRDGMRLRTEGNCRPRPGFLPDGLNSPFECSNLCIIHTVRMNLWNDR